MSYKEVTQAAVLGAMLVCAAVHPCLASVSVSKVVLPGSRRVSGVYHLHEEGTQAGGSLAVGGKPYSFQAKDLSGKSASLSQYKGKVVLLDFWATWCGPCCDEVPNVVAAYNKYHAQGFDVLAVSLDSSRSSLMSFIKQNHVPYRQIFDGKGWDNSVAKLYQVDSIPHCILISRTGVILAIDPRGSDLAPAIRSALANNPPVVQGGGMY